MEDVRAKVSVFKKLVDFTGQRFGRLVVTSRAPDFGGRVQWNCLCDCGTAVVVTAHYLTIGRAESCQRGPIKRRYGKRTAVDRGLISRWNQMLIRCSDPDAPNYQYYGGRGIRVCDEWIDYQGFREWALKSGYADDLTLDRIDADGDYEPNNCRWASLEEQANNKRSNRRMTIAGEPMTAAQASRRYGVNYSTLHARLRKGWSDEEAVFRPV